MERKSANERGYNSRWQSARLTYLRSHPLCVGCEKIGRVVLASDVDHIKPHKGDQSLFWDQDNWQGLCRSCHNSKTAREDGAFGNKGKTKASKACGLDGLPVDSQHHWNM